MSTCRQCGCTDEGACPGGCWWIEPDLCSACGPDRDEDVYCDCGAVHTEDEIASGHCDCCGGIIDDE